MCGGGNARQCLCLRVERSLKAEDVRVTLETLFKDYGKPLYLRSDNGSEFIAKSLQGWLAAHVQSPCSLNREARGKTANVRVSTASSGMSAANMELFDSLKEAQVVIEAWREEYNNFRPHSALNYQTPDAFAKATKAQRAPNEGASLTKLPKGALNAFYLGANQS